MRSCRVNFLRPYLIEGEQRRHGHARREDKGRSVRNVISKSAHARRRDTRADRSESRVPTQARAYPSLANEAEADRRDRGTQHATRACLQNPRGEDDGKDRRHGERKGTDSNGGDSGRRDPALRPCGVNNRATWNLPNQTDDSASRQDETNIGLGPFFSGQIDGYEGAESGLHVRQKKDKPVESAAATKRWIRRAHP